MFKHFCLELINYIKKGRNSMYYYGGYQGYGNACGYGGGNYGGTYGTGYGAAIILVLFILLVIVIGARAFGTGTR